MTELKKDIEKEFRNYLKNLIVLIFTIIPLYFEISLAEKFINSQNDKLLWFMDLGIYNFIFSIIVSTIMYFYSSLKTTIDIKLFYTEDKLKNVKIKHNENKKIILEITAKGKRENIPAEIVLNYPDWLDMQIKGRPYLTSLDEHNQYVFNLKKMFNQQKEINQTKEIAIDLIGNGNAEEKNKIEIIPELIKGNRNPLRRIKFQGLKIEIKG